MTTPTQVQRPWRATVRTAFQFVIALASLLPFIAAGVYTDADQAPVIVGQVLAVAATITRVMALPQVEAFLSRFFPFLAADPDDHGEGGAVHIDVGFILGVALAILLALAAWELLTRLL